MVDVLCFTWCGGCPFLQTVWWMSGVVDGCVVDAYKYLYFISGSDHLKVGIELLWQLKTEM